MNTKHKGDLAVAQAIAVFASMNYEILLPLGDKQRYDLVVDGKNGLERVQVKYAGYDEVKGFATAHLETRGGNQSFSTTKKYEADDFDLLFVYTGNGDRFLIPWKEMTTATKIFFRPNSKYNAYKV